MTTTLTIGPLVDPLTPDERRKLQKFITTGIEHGGEVWIWQDRTIGAVWGVAKIGGPAERATTTSGATS